MSKSFTKKVFDWLRQVRTDKRVQKLDVVVALQMTDYFNEDAKDGRAWPSYKTIGDAINVPEKSIIISIERLAATGHLYVVKGRRGRGHSNQYWMILEPATTPGIKPVTTPGIKPVTTPGFKNLSPAPENLSPRQENHLKNQKMGGSAPTRGGARDPQEAQAGAEIPGEQIGAAASINALKDRFRPDADADAELGRPSAAPLFAEFEKAYPKKTGMNAARMEFLHLCDGWTLEDPLYIIARAKLYAKDFEGERARYAIPAKQWLHDRCFNDPLPDGVIIDNDTGEFVVPEAAPKRGQRKSMSEIGQDWIARHCNGSVS